MRILNIDAVLGTLPAATVPATPRLDLQLFDDDRMYEGAHDADYLHCGASALNIILSAQAVAGVAPPPAILDFGAGAGRVTRWLRAAFPEAAIDACDLRGEDMRFCGETFGAQTWISGTDIGALAAPRRYDLIWVGSVLTHLSAMQAARLIDKLVSWTSPGGLLVMSTIGRIAAARRDDVHRAYIHEAGWQTIRDDYERSGFGYADYVGQQGYGVSLIKLSWMGALVEHLPEVRMVLLSEGAWDELHDIVALQRLTEPLPLGGAGGSAETFVAWLAEDVARRARLGDIERSRLWRLLKPVREFARSLPR